MKLYVEFTSPKTPKLFSEVIKLVQRTPYSHVRLRWVSHAGDSVVYEASGGSVRFLGPKAQELNPVTVHDCYTYSLTKKQYKQLLKVCMSNAGLHYGFLQAIGIGLDELFDLGRNPFPNGDDIQICSETVAIVLGITADRDRIGPKQLKEILDEQKRKDK